MKRSYLVYAPPYDESSGGIKVCHRMAVEIQKRGFNVFINTPVQNKKWLVIPYFDNFDIEKKEPILQNAIAIYPDIIHDNPFNAGIIVRYLLNIPEFSGGPPIESYPETDIFYTYSRLFNTKLHLPAERVMLCPHIDTAVFYDRKLKRNGRLVYRGKGRQPDDERLFRFPSLGVKEGHKGDAGQEALADKLNRAELLYCMDNATAITEIARLCGCAVVLLPDGSYSYEDYKKHEFYGAGGMGYGILESSIARATIDSEIMARWYRLAEEEFQERLGIFIKLTQEA
jgi:hypothetical protein